MERCLNKGLVWEFFVENTNYSLKRQLKVKSCKLYNNKYMIPSTQITNTEICAFIAALAFYLLRCNCLLTEKDNRNC